MRQRDLFDFRKVPPRDPEELREKFPNLDQSWKPNPNPRYVGDEYRRQLTENEMTWATHIGTVVAQKGVDENCVTTLGVSEQDDSLEDRRESMIQGARCEIIVAKKYDLAYPTDFRDRKTPVPDFGPRNGPGLVVRSSSLMNPSLIVRPRDPANSVAVLVCEFAPGDGRIHAWCWVRDAQRETPLTSPAVQFRSGKKQVHKPAHFVRMTIDGQPNPIVHVLGTFPTRGEEIPASVLDLCLKGYRAWMVR